MACCEALAAPPSMAPADSAEPREPREPREPTDSAAEAALPLRSVTADAAVELATFAAVSAALAASSIGLGIGLPNSRRRERLSDITKPPRADQQLAVRCKQETRLRHHWRGSEIDRPRSQDSEQTSFLLPRSRHEAFRRWHQPTAGRL